MRPRAWGINGLLLGRIVDLFSFERRSLTYAIKNTKPDIVHAHWAYEFGAAALRSGFPHVITSHDSPFDIAQMASKEKITVSSYRWLRTLIAKKVLKSARCVTTVSPYLQQRIQPITTCKVLVVPNPVDDLALALATPRLPKISPAIAMVCNGWDARKNPEPGLLAFTQLMNDMPGATMHLYGNDFGPGQTAETWCKAKGIEKGMHFHGAVPHKQLLKELAQHDLLLHTSIEESFGMVIAEAMAMGLPVVAGNASGAVPWVVGEHGELCDVRSSAGVCTAIKAALGIDRYKQNSQNGISITRERFSPVSITDSYLTHYQRAIEKNNIAKS